MFFRQEGGSNKPNNPKSSIILIDTLFALFTLYFLLQVHGGPTINKVLGNIILQDIWLGLLQNRVEAEELPRDFSYCIMGGQPFLFWLFKHHWSKICGPGL